MIAALALAGTLAGTLAGGDSLTLSSLLERVRSAHPVARQAELAQRQAASDLRATRGGFDPVLSARWDYKRFKGIGYFDELDTRLTVPTPWGVDVTLGWERAAGAIINPERTTPAPGLLSAGLSIPLGPRLITDERRTTLRQAELAADAADADANAQVARLLQLAARDWGAWFESEARARIAADGVELASFRLDAVRRRVAAGDAAPIDSLEALAEWERRLLQEVDARAAAAGARLVVSGYLWDRRGAPVALAAGAEPARDELLTRDAELGQAAIDRAIREHPLVRQARARWLQADAQRRLTLVQVLPTVSADVAALAAGSSLGALPSPFNAADDLKAGLSVRLPLFARRELGRLRAAEDRALQLLTERDRMERDVRLVAERALVDLRAVEAQRGGQARVLSASEALLAAEQRRFEIGESSLLFVNLRERAVLDERLRSAQLDARRAAALGSLVAALGSPELLIAGHVIPPAR